MNLPACLLPQVQRQDLEDFTSPLKVAVGDLQRWVLKIVGHKLEPDELYFRDFQQDEDPGSCEPAWWHASLTDHGTGLLNQVILDTYLEPDAAVFGDIRLGRSWRTVTQLKILRLLRQIRLIRGAFQCRVALSTLGD